MEIVCNMLNLWGMSDNKPTHRLREILDEGVFSQAQLAEDSGIPKSSISEFYNGKKDLREDHIRKLAKAMKIPVWQLFLDPDLLPSDEEKEVLESYRNSPEHMKQAVRTILFLEQVNPKQESMQVTLHEKEQEKYK